MSTNEQLVGIASDIATQIASRLASQEVTVAAPDEGMNSFGQTTGDGFSFVAVSFAGSNGGLIGVSLNDEMAAALSAEGTSIDAMAVELSAASLPAIGANVEPADPTSAEAFMERSGSAISSVSIPLMKGDQIVGCVSALIDNDGAATAEFGTLDEVNNITSMGARSLDLLNDVEMGVAVELGRARMSVREILSLTPGSVVELDRAAGSPVDLLVNGTLVARGEVVVIDEEFGIRITDIIGHEDSTKRAG